MDVYLNEWQSVSYKKKSLLTKEGETQLYLYFVTKGIQKSYYLHDGKEHIIAFTYAPSFTGIPESFMNQIPSKCFLETITESEFLRISYDKHQQFLKEYRPLETLFRRGVEILLAGIIDRHIELMAFDIETRFKSFMKRRPHLLNQVSQKDLASYLRINPTNFSKLLAKVKI